MILKNMCRNWTGEAVRSNYSLLRNNRSICCHLYFAYDDEGLYFAANILDPTFIASTGVDNVDNSGSSHPYGWNGDVMTLTWSDPLSGAHAHPKFGKEPLYLATRTAWPTPPAPQYRTTDKFLMHFGISSLDELPDINELQARLEPVDGTAQKGPFEV